MRGSLPNQNKSIAFIGFMGVGKTTIAREVAKKLGRAFIDIDEYIEKSYQMSATEIFATYGEDQFRRSESEAIKKWCQEPKRVVSLGGGAFLNEENQSFCLAHTVVVALHMEWHEWENRLPMLVANRPNLQNRSIEEIKELYDARQDIYKKYHIQIVINGTESVAEITENVIDELKYIR